jgi:hypothetical protein
MASDYAKIVADRVKRVLDNKETKLEVCISTPVHSERLVE